MMRHVWTIPALAAVVMISIPMQAKAFSEDLCVFDADDESGQVIGNCLSTDCDPASVDDTSSCRANLLFDAAAASSLADEGLARSMMHVDAVHFLAQAAGLDETAAYWIAAYNEVPDTGHYVPFGMFGDLIEQGAGGVPVDSIALNGWARTSGVSGGVGYHFPAPFNAVAEPMPVDCTDFTGGTVCGLYPDLEDRAHEGLLTHLRDWVFEGASPCVDGLTDPTGSGIHYGGAQCYSNDPALRTDSSSVEPRIHGTIPALSTEDMPVTFDAYSGRQLAAYQEVDGQLEEVRYADRLEVLLASHYRWSLPQVLDGRSLRQHVALIRMAIYLHALQDRISHHECTDASFVSGPDENGDFTYEYDPELCTRDLHAYNHMLEVGWSELPDRTASALEYAYDELETFAEAFPMWRRAGAPVTDQAWRTQVLDDVLDVMRISDGCQRLRAMILLIDRYGYDQMPGNDAADTASMCDTPEDSDRGSDSFLH